MRPVNKRHLMWATAAALIATVTSAASQTANWPTRPITLVIPYPAGLTMDIVGRQLGDYLSSKFGQPVVVDNRVGAVGTIGTRAVARAAPDGYTIVLGGAVALALSPMMFKDLGGFDPIKEIVPIVTIYKTPHVLIASHKAPVKSFAELMAFAKANPGKLNAGVAAGIGSTAHMNMEMLMAATGGKVTIVPYRASPPLADLAGGQIDVASVLIQDFAELLKENLVQGLAVTSTTPVAGLPNLPTVSSLGMPGFETTAWFGLGAPLGTPPEVIAKINAATNEYLALEKTKQFMATMHTIAVGGSPDDARAFTDSELKKWSPTVKALNLQF